MMKMMKKLALLLVLAMSMNLLVFAGAEEAPTSDIVQEQPEAAEAPVETPAEATPVWQESSEPEQPAAPAEPAPEQPSESEPAAPETAEQPEAPAEPEAPAFTARVRIELKNTEPLYYGDSVTLKAIVEEANAAYTVRWQYYDEEASAEKKEDIWANLTEGNEYTFAVNTTNAVRKYRAVVNDTVISSAYTLPQVHAKPEVTEEPETDPDEEELPEATETVAPDADVPNGEEADEPTEDETPEANPETEEPDADEETDAPADETDPEADPETEEPDADEATEAPAEEADPEADPETEEPDADEVTDAPAEEAEPEADPETEEPDADEETDAPTEEADPEADSETEEPDADEETDAPTEEADPEADSETEEPDADEETDTPDEDGEDSEGDEGTVPDQDEETESAGVLLNPDRSVTIYAEWNGEALYFGDESTLVAVLLGYDNAVYTLQWQTSKDNIHWYDVEGATEARYTMIVTEENYLDYWRVIVTITNVTDSAEADVEADATDTTDVIE